MSATTPVSDNRPEELSREQFMSALFSSMVIQQANMALMFLGKVPNPQTGEHLQELDTARMIIDQLEMLEVKTRGNLTPGEDKLLKDTLMSVRLQFVEAANAAPAQPDKAAPAPAAPTQPQPPTSSPPPSQTATTAPGSSGEEESRKKFTKKY